MKRHAPPTAQRGVALWMLLILVAMAGGYAFYRSANSQFSRSESDARLAISLARAKEAVIAYAVLDDQRPGRLLCPDLIGDGVSPLLSRDDCDSYIGNLPWKTLDVRDFQDDHGMPLQLAVYRLFGGDRPTPPINSETPTAMRLTAADGSVNNDVVAVIIAPRGALDPANSDGDDHFLVGRSSTDGDNDVIAVITRQELMAAAEKRVANEVRSCLDSHAASSANTDHRYPWPAPLSVTNYQGKANSLFGRVPATQPTAGPEAALKSTITKLSRSLNLLSLAPDASQQMTALNALSDALLPAKNLFDAIFLKANQLKQLADDAYNELHGVELAVTSAATNGRISRSEGTKIRSLSATPDSPLTALADQISQLGVDVFPWQISQYSTRLGQANTAADFASLTLGIRQLLYATVSARPDISPSLIAAQTSASLACDPTNPIAPACDGSLAMAAAGGLINALNTLQSAVESSRVSVLANDVSAYATPLNSLNATFRTAPTSDNLNALLAALNGTRAAVADIATGVPGVVTARNSASTAFDGAIAAIQSSPPDYATIGASTSAAIASVTTLAASIASNEQVDNNVTHTSLRAAITIYESKRTAFTQLDTASPRPVQPRNQLSQLAQSALALGDATVNLEIWAKSISDNASLVAPLAKANPVTTGDDPGSARILDTSAYKIANDALTSITGKNESAALLQAYIDNPNATTGASAIAALGETTALVNTLLNAANALDNSLASTTASGFPMVWLSSRCDFLLPSATSWWTKNEWAGTLFYQISNVSMNEPGKLRVNAAGTYRLVTLAAGRAIGAQNRATPGSANFLESINADPTRDGDATAPVPDFTATTPSATFNDRLAY